MADYGLNLWDYWRIIHKRKWIILSIFLISIFSSQFFSEKSEPVYRSSATLFVNSRRTPVAEITGSGVTFWGGDSGANLNTQLELMKGYKNLREVAIRLGYIDADTESAKVQGIVFSLRGKISVRLDGNTDLVHISAVDTDPVKAKDIVQAVVDVFIKDTWEQKIESARNTKKFVEEQLSKLEKTINTIIRRLEDFGVTPGLSIASTLGASDVNLRARLAQLQLELANLREIYTDNYPGILNILSEIKNIKKIIKEEPKRPEKEEMDPDAPLSVLSAEQLRNELAINQKLYGYLKERYEKASIMEASNTQDIEIVNPATIPGSPSTAAKAANIFFGAIIGAVLGLVAALIIESMDTSIGTIEDVEEYLQLPVLGVIPRIEVTKKDMQVEYWKNPPPPEEKKKYVNMMSRLITQYRPKSPIAEAYRNLQTYIRFSGFDKVGNALMFTSAGIQEGKTITSVNCALSMAQLGYKVLLVDADLRRPSVHKIFGIEREMGLTEVVLGTFNVEDVVKTIDDVMMGNIKSSMILQTYGMENLNIMTTGHLPSNPTELISSKNMTEFIKEVKEKFQVVFFDTAPILPVTDSCLLGSKVDGAILVYEVGRVSRGALKRAKLQIENAKGKPVGVVLNGMRASDMKFGSPFYYYYQKYYGEGPEQK